MHTKTMRCKKCGKILPSGYKSQYCERCTRELAGQTRIAGGVAAGIIGAIAATAYHFLKKKKK